MRSYSPGVKFFYAAKLIRLETRGISYYVLDGSCPPVTRLAKGSPKMDNVGSLQRLDSG